MATAYLRRQENTSTQMATEQATGGRRSIHIINSWGWKWIWMLLWLLGLNWVQAQTLCDFGYYLEDSSCYACHASWATWSDSSSCLTCKKNFVKNGIFISCPLVLIFQMTYCNLLQTLVNYFNEIVTFSFMNLLGLALPNHQHCLLFISYFGPFTLYFWQPSPYFD